jgi:hypothetical protein
MTALHIGQVTINSLDPALDAAFTAFYQAVQKGVMPNEGQFDSAAGAFLSGTTQAPDHDGYFNNFTPLWQMHMQSQHFSAAESVWSWALRPALALESSGATPIHKGTPYYFWGMTALLGDRLDVGYLLMHRAFEEDVRTHGSTAPNTPGWALLTLDHHRPDQAFRSWVQLQAKAVEERVIRYNKLHGRAFDLRTMRTRFLAQPQYRESVQLYCYAMARVNRLLGLPPQLWEGPFPAQVAFDALFDICLVIDAVIHLKYPTDWRFISLAEALSSNASLRLSRAQLGEINTIFLNSFGGALSKALNGTLTLKDGTLLGGLANSLSIAYGCRNRGAHSVATVPLTNVEFDNVVDHLSAVLFLAIETMYP